jgi:hypothetical protein
LSEKDQLVLAAASAIPLLRDQHMYISNFIVKNVINKIDLRFNKIHIAKRIAAIDKHLNFGIISLLGKNKNR